MEEYPSWEANSRSANQKSPLISWNKHIYYRVYKWSPLVLTMSQLNPPPLFALQTQFSKYLLQN
jgi:hypothetical protein